MANIDDFGIVKADVLKLLNPDLSPNAIQIGTAASGTGASGTGGVGANTTWTVAGQTWTVNEWVNYSLILNSTAYLVLSNSATILTVAEDLTGKSGAWAIASGIGADKSWTVASAAWDVDQWADYQLVKASVEYHILSNIATVLTVAENLSSKIGDWSIKTHHPEYSDTEFASLVAEQVALVKGNLPQKYQMLYEVNGEIIVGCATSLQPTASLGFATDDITLVRLYRNYIGKYGSRNREFHSLTEGAGEDFEIAVNKTDITFHLAGTGGPGLSTGDRIYADYTHALPTVPKVLKAITIRLIAYEIYRATLSAHPDTIEHKDYEQKDPTGLLTQLLEGKLAIDEFDKLVLVVETDKIDSPGYGSVPSYRA